LTTESGATNWHLQTCVIVLEDRSKGSKLGSLWYDLERGTVAHTQNGAWGTTLPPVNFELQS